MNPAEFEKELRNSLRRHAAPPGFADRVNAKVSHQLSQPRSMKATVLPWALAAGLTLGLAIPSAVYQRHNREQQAKAVAAARELITALNITRAKLRHTRENIQRRAHGS